MKRWFGLLLIACLLGTTEIPAALMQSFAWTGMAARLHRHEGWKASLQETFDGRHPCSICLRLNKASRAPKLSTMTPPQCRLCVLPPGATSTLDAVEISAIAPFPPQLERSIDRVPVFPPPKTAA